MAKKPRLLQRSPLARSLHVSMAGARTGSALIADKALNMLIPGRNANPLLKKEAKKFVTRLGQMKGTYVKVGQMLAMVGEYVLPLELTEALHTLESATEPMPWIEAEDQLKAQLGAKMTELKIDPNPIGVASLAQVHRATVIKTGDQICLKLLYPGVKETISSDFNAVIRMLKLTRWIKLSQDFDQWLELMHQQLLHEVDYPREIRMTETASRLLGDDTRYKIPTIYHHYCANELIAMEYLEGCSVSDKRVTELPQERRNQLAENMLDLFFNEIYQWQLFQTDPNFGNYKIAIGEHHDQLILLDFGSVIDNDPLLFSALGDTIFAAQQENREDVVDGLTRLGCLTESSSEAAQKTFVDFCIEIMEPMRDIEHLPTQLLNAQGAYRWSESKLMKRAAMIAGRSVTSQNFDLPSQNFALVTRKLIGVFTFISLLKAEFNGAPILKNHL